MSKIKIAFRNIKSNKARSSVFIILSLVIVTIQLLLYSVSLQYEKKYDDLAYEMKSRVTIYANYQTQEDNYIKNPFVYENYIEEEVISEEQYNLYKESKYIKDSVYSFSTNTNAVANGDFNELEYREENVYDLEWELHIGFMITLDQANLSIPIIAANSFDEAVMLETSVESNDFELIDGKAELKDGEILLEEKTARTLNVKIGDTLQLRQSLWEENSGFMEDTGEDPIYYYNEETDFPFVDYSVTVSGIYRNERVEEDNEEYTYVGTNYATMNTILEYNELVRNVPKTEKFANLNINTTYESAYVEFILKNPNDIDNFRNEVSKKGLGNNYTLISMFENGYADANPLTNVEQQLKIACILVTIIAIFIYVLFSLRETKTRKKEVSILYLLGYSRKDIWSIIFLEKLLLLLVSGIIAIIVSQLFMKELVEQLLTINYTYYYKNVFGFDYIEDIDPLGSMKGYGHKDLMGIENFAQMKLSLQPLHYLVLLFICLGDALVSSVGVFRKKRVKNHDFLERK